jgi:hypothetical protein
MIIALNPPDPLISRRSWFFLDASPLRPDAKIPGSG